MDHCLSFTGGFGDLPYLSTIPFHLQLLNLQFSYKYIYLSWKYSRTKFKNILGNEWDGLISGLIAVASILLCFPENPTGFSANPLLFCSANPVAMQPYFRHTSARQPYFCHMSAFTRKYFVRFLLGKFCLQEFSTLSVTLKSWQRSKKFGAL